MPVRAIKYVIEVELFCAKWDYPRSARGLHEETYEDLDLLRALCLDVVHLSGKAFAKIINQQADNTFSYLFVIHDSCYQKNVRLSTYAGRYLMTRIQVSVSEAAFMKYSSKPRHFSEAGGS